MTAIEYNDSAANFWPNPIKNLVNGKDSLKKIM